MLLFSRPVYGNDPPGIGQFNVPQYSLTNDYASMLTSLWVPPGSGSLGSDVRLFGDPNAGLIPHAHADFDSNTASSFGFMQAYNQFSGNRSALVNVTGMGGSGTATVGGLGRKGATQLVIFETDGMANEDSQPQSGSGGLTNGGSYNSYYNIRPTDPVNGGGYNQNALLQVVEAICNRDDGTPISVPTGYPTPPSISGYATPNKPVIVQCIAFGAIFETSNSAQIERRAAVARHLDDRRHHVPQLVHGPGQRLQVVHRYAAATPAEAAAGVPEHPGQQRAGVADPVEIDKMTR